jgi:radical SAM superfamily enzyme YgiQ (UPF0313 family)
MFAGSWEFAAPVNQSPAGEVNHWRGGRFFPSTEQRCLREPQGCFLHSTWFTIVLMASKPRVIFHQLPPVNAHQPDIAYTIMKGHLGAHGVESRTIYWNLHLRRFYDRFLTLTPDIYTKLVADIESRPTVFYLGPFLLQLLGDEETPQSKLARASLLAYYASLFPEMAVQDPGYLESWLNDLREDIMGYLSAEIDKLDVEDGTLWAVSCKFNQWIPGLVLTRLVRQRRPDLPLVIGGIASKEEATTMMRVFSHANYAIWSEGEQALLALVRKLDANDGDLDSVPRLIYRRDGELRFSQVECPDTGPLPRDDVSDYFAAQAELSSGPTQSIPEVSLNTIRGCSWARCRFCNLHQSVSLRHKEPAQIIEEIRDLATRYGVKRITFANMDIHDSNARRFDQMVDGLIALQSEEGLNIDYTSDIAATRLTAPMIRRLVMAGFAHLLVGFEALTDGLLKKVNKAHRFAHNICFMKLTDKFRMNHEVNILMGVPDEAREDVLESIQNLHYLRFYPPGMRGSAYVRPMFLGARAPYETAMSDAERERWTLDDAYSPYGFLPESIVSAGNRMHLGSFRAPLRHGDLWNQFKIVLGAYQKARREYLWLARSGEVVLQERSDGEVVKELALEPDYFEVLRLANERVVSFSEVARAMKEAFPETAEDRLHDIVSDLKAEYLLYADEKQHQLIAIVDTDGMPASDLGA